MASTPVLLRRTLGLGMAAALIVSACGGTTTSPSASAPASEAPTTAPSGEPSPSEGAGPAKGGTAYLLNQAEQFDYLDPQRVYTGEDLAFLGATIHRSLVTYIVSADPVEGNSLQPDLATDLGTPNADFTEWSFTIRDGATWEDGAPVTAEDVKYGVSRTFATDVINNGPQFAIGLLDIPKDAEGASAYKGPYTKVGQELFDAAVTVEGNTITFKLNKPASDFNFTTTLGMSPVRAADDTGETYGTPTNPPTSNGPYKVESYTTGPGGKLILVRNENWDQASDTVRKAYPDKWEVQFGIDAKVLDQRIMASAGEDAFALQYGQVQPENLTTIFTDPETPAPDFTGRAVSDFDPYSYYYWIDTIKVPNLKHRQAMMVALDRDALIANAGGAFAGDVSDGAIKPNIGADYAPTGIWDTFFGKQIDPAGDPELAQQLIAESGEPIPELVFSHSATEVNAKAAAIVIDSLSRAGITVTASPIEPGVYYSTVFDPTNELTGHFGTAGWGPDWPNASTVIPPLFQGPWETAGFNLSRVNDAAFNTGVEDALATADRAAQAPLWQALNKTAVENAWIIPYRFGLSQVIAGTKVGPVYQWPAYGSWPYSETYVTP